MHIAHYTKCCTLQVRSTTVSTFSTVSIISNHIPTTIYALVSWDSSLVLTLSSPHGLTSEEAEFHIFDSGAVLVHCTS